MINNVRIREVAVIRKMLNANAYLYTIFDCTPLFVSLQFIRYKIYIQLYIMFEHMLLTILSSTIFFLSFRLPSLQYWFMC